MRMARLGTMDLSTALALLAGAGFCYAAGLPRSCSARPMAHDH